jgi:hypothetical protein
MNIKKEASNLKNISKAYKKGTDLFTTYAKQQVKTSKKFKETAKTIKRAI